MYFGSLDHVVCVDGTIVCLGSFYRLGRLFFVCLNSNYIKKKPCYFFGIPIQILGQTTGCLHDPIFVFLERSGLHYFKHGHRSGMGGWGWKEVMDGR